MNGGGKSCIDGFNVARKNISASFMKVGDDFMSAIRFRMTEKGNLTHFPYIFRKPEPLGKEFNTVAYYVTGDFLSIEIKRGKEGKNNTKFHIMQLGATAACKKIITEAIKWIGQRGIKGIPMIVFILKVGSTQRSH